MNSLFVRFLRHPGQVGAFCPSSRFLAVEMTQKIGMEDARTNVELGPGTGAITRRSSSRARRTTGASSAGIRWSSTTAQSAFG